MNQLVKTPHIRLNKTLLPESKSILIRVVFITAFTTRNAVINTTSLNEDIKVMLSALKQLGKKILYTHSQLTIYGTNTLPKVGNTINLKNSGITARIMCVFAMLLGQRKLTLVGNTRLYKRPFKETINTCRKLLLNNPLKFLKHNDKLPIQIVDKPHIKIPHTLYVSCKHSSQTITALLLVLPLILKKKLTIKLIQPVSKPYIKLAIKLLQEFNINIHYDKDITVYPGNYISRKPIYKLIEKDNSAIPYYIFNKLNNLYRLKINIKTLTSKQQEIKIIKVLNSIGFKLTKHTPRQLRCYSNKPQIKYLTINCSEIIDTAMLLPLLTLKNIKKIKLYNIYNWNYKECKRITALNKEIKKIGLKTKKGSNWLKVNCHKLRNNIVIDTYKDHRIFLSMFQYSNNCNITINNPNNIKKSFPNFLKQCLKH
ncbi:hypothetical protein JS520_00570 [Candidatus Vidania fulgoroideae]|nr:hypothetical protein JS520_00570 [Candidatus Vidania fulgoroideae]